MEIKKLTFSNSDIYEGEILLDMPNGYGKFVSKEGYKYEGYWLNGLPHHQGKLTFLNNESYVGGFFNGLMNGKGSFYDTDNQFLVSQEYDKGKLVLCKEDADMAKTMQKIFQEYGDEVKNVFGINYIKLYKENYKNVFHNNEFKKTYKTINYTNGNVYYGQIQNNLSHGKGVFVYPSGEAFVGDFLNGYRHGHGVLYLKNFQMYVGDFLNGEINGKGKYIYSNGYYEGEWQNGTRNGYGKYVFDDNSYYEGYWLNQKYNGKGKYVFADGTVYEGNWIDSKKQGKFFITENGKSYTTQFDDNVEVKTTLSNNYSTNSKQIVYSDGSFYIGEKRCNYREGSGKLFYSNGQLKYDGEFVNDEYSGKGKLYDKKGDLLYSGTFRRGKKHMYGEEHNGSEVYIGEFENGLRNGQGVLVDYSEGDCYGESMCYKGTFKDGEFVKGKKMNLEQYEELYGKF